MCVKEQDCDDLSIAAWVPIGIDKGGTSPPFGGKHLAYWQQFLGFL